MPSQTLDVGEFRNALGRFATGVIVVTALDGENTHGMTASAFLSVSLNPPLVLVSLDNRSHMHRVVAAAGRYGISVLAQHQSGLSDHFAGRARDDVDDIRFVRRAGTPLIDGAVAYFVVKVVDAYSAGDHTLYIGFVEYFERREETPLLIYAGRYRRLLLDA